MSIVSEAMPQVERGCGSGRDAGGVYLEVPTGPVGLPLEAFLLDPPIPTTEDELALRGVNHRGVHLVHDAAGTPHVADWISCEHYPNVTDFLEEARRFGISRRIQKTFPFKELRPSSCLLLLHDRGWITDPAPYWAYQYQKSPISCPRHEGRHSAGMCVGLWWHDLAPETITIDDPDERHGPGAKRQMPGFSYRAYMRAPVAEPSYQVAWIAQFPIIRLGVVRDPDGETHVDAFNKARQSPFPVLLQEH